MKLDDMMRDGNMRVPQPYKHTGKRHVSNPRLVTEGLPNTAKESQSKGLKRYFTGNSCPRGHVADRLVSTRKCIACCVEDDRKRDPIKQRARALRGQWRRNGMPTPTRPKPERCELCGGPPTARSLHLDHDKKTGVFRGWLCHYCNTALGRFGDSVKGLKRAIDYLQGHVHHGN